MTLQHLIDLSEHYFNRVNSDSSTRLPGIFVIRKIERTHMESLIYKPVICLILRGGKNTSIGFQSAQLNAGDALLISHDLPVISSITEASAEAPYLALILTLDIGLIRNLYEAVGGAVSETADAQSLTTGFADPSWTDPLGRYLSLMDNPVDAQVVGPLVLREIHYRLLMSPIGGMLRNLLSVDSHASRVAKVILHIRTQFRTPLAMADLAQLAGMGQSSFHEHFKAVTGTTPLQYQKELRMFEARDLLGSGGMSVSAVSYEVGYESSTQFSREYTRRFGVPPKAHLRKPALTAV